MSARSPSLDMKNWPLPLAVSLVLCGFASNSLLCRAALGGGWADPATFTLIRLSSGFLALAFLARGNVAWRSVRLGPSLALALYALGFSFAYRSVGAGTGALLLFGAVQVTMLAVTRLRGGPLAPAQALGAALAFSGLLVLTLPGAHAPPLWGALSMLGAGAAWGAYSLWGRGSAQPVMGTLGSFAGATSVAFFAFLFAPHRALSPRGLVLAVLSGTLASGATYSLWYTVLPRLGALRAAVVQLAVPVMTAAAAALLLGEIPTRPWFLAAALTLSGIALAMKPVAHRR